MKKTRILFLRIIPPSLKGIIVLIFLALSMGVSMAQVNIALNDPKIYYDGVLFPVITSTSVTFNKHTSAAYSDATSGMYYAPTNRTRATQSGVRVRLKTASPNVYFTFAPQLSPDGYFFNSGNADGSYSAAAQALGGRDGFAVFVNGTLKQTISSTLSFTATNPTPGTAVEFEVTLPNLWSVVLTSVKVDNGYSLVDAGTNTKPKYAAFGTSITNGTGQYVNTVKTYAFKVAQAKGWNLHNFAVAGSTVGWQASYDVQNTVFDFITIEQGFNDWASFYSEDLSVVQAKYAKLIDQIRIYQPNAKVYCIGPIVTTASPQNEKYTLDQFRAMVKGLVDTRTSAGDNKLFYINGASISDASMLDDGIHLNEYGADRFATALIPLLPGTVLPPPPPVAGFIAANDPNFLYTGRVDFTNPKRPQFAFPGVSIKANFQGTAVSVVIKDYGIGGDNNTNYFNIIIDNGTPIKLQVNNSDTLYPISSTLADGNHSIEIFKRTETSVGKSEFRGLVLASGKTLLAPPARPSKRFEFIGDSYTCGYGNEVATTSPNTGFHSVNENNYMAWGAIASRTLNAEYMCTSYSGRGMYRNNTGQTTFTIPTIYDEILADQTIPAWNKNNFIPDVAVIMLGINDMFPYSNGGTKLDSASFVNTYINFVTKLRGYYPSACIICAVPNGLSDYYPDGAFNWTHMKNYITAIVNNFKNKGDSKVYNWVMIQQGSQNEPYGEDWHPSIQTHQIMANDLVNFMNGTVGCGSGVVNPVNPSITFSNVTKTYGDAVFNVTATSNSTGAITYSSNNNAVATVTASGSITIKGTGSVTITANQSAATGYNAGSATMTLTISKATLTARADDKSKVAGAANPAFTITYSGFVYGETASVLTSVPAASTTATTASPAGTYPITLTGGSAANYTITLVNGVLIVTSAANQDPTINFSNTTKTYGDAAFNVVATSNSFGAITYSSSNNAVATVAASGFVTIKGAGSVTITANQTAATGYNAGSATMTLTIGKATLTARADDKSKVAGVANPVFTITYTGFVYGETASVLTSAPAASTTATTASPAGTYPITLTGGSAANYTITLVNGTLTVTSVANQDPTINLNVITKTYGDAEFNVSATSSSSGAFTYSITAGSAFATITSSGLVTIKGAGSVTIKADQAAATGFNAGSATATLTINKANLTATADNKSKVTGSANPALTITYTGFVYGEIASVLTSVPTASTTATAVSAAGTYPITLSGGSAANYNIVLVNGTLTVTAVVDNGTCTVAAWSATAVYNSGAQVSYNGEIYFAKWYSVNSIPGVLIADIPGSDEWGPWQHLGPCSNMNGCSAYSWISTIAYFQGCQVAYNGDVYAAKWYSVGTTPSSDPYGPWQLNGACGSSSATVCTAMAWNSAIAYFAGNEVSYNGSLYKAKWWTSGNIPGADQWGPWELAGPCGSTPSAPANAMQTTETLDAYPSLISDGVDFINVNVNLSDAGKVTLILYNMNNEEVRVIANDILQDASHVYMVPVAELNSGIYILKLTTSEGVTTKKISK